MGGRRGGGRRSNRDLTPSEQAVVDANARIASAGFKSREAERIARIAASAPDTGGVSSITLGDGTQVITFDDDAVREPTITRFDTPGLLKYVNVNPSGFDFVRTRAKEQFGFPNLAMMNERIDWAATEWAKENGGRPPSPQELYSYPKFQNTMALLANGGSLMDNAFIWQDTETGLQHTVINNGFEWSELPQGVVGTTPGRAVQDYFGNLRVYDDEALSQLLSNLSPISGGGAGSGAGRADRAFDRAQLVDAATERWRGLLLEDPGETRAGSIADEYMKEANAFWMREGGNLDYDTFVLGKIRGESRHKYLYGKKPGFQSEAEYMTGFRNVLAGQGINEQATLREIEAGASSGVGLAGFSERVGRTREARLTNTGGFGNQLAGNMAATGIGRT